MGGVEMVQMTVAGKCVKKCAMSISEYYSIIKSNGTWYGMVLPAFNPSTQEAEAGGSPWVWTQPGVQSEFQGIHGYPVSIDDDDDDEDDEEEDDIASWALVSVHLLLCSWLRIQYTHSSSSSHTVTSPSWQAVTWNYKPEQTLSSLSRFCQGVLPQEQGENTAMHRRCDLGGRLGRSVYTFLSWRITMSHNRHIKGPEDRRLLWAKIFLGTT